MAEPVADVWALPSVAETEHRGYGLRDLARTLFRRRRLVALFALGVMAVVALGLITGKPSYEATASILVKKGAARVPLTPTETQVWISDNVSEEDINTEIGILTSRVLIEGVVRTLAEQETRDPAPSWWQQARTRWRAWLDDLLNRKPIPALEAKVDRVMRALSVSAVPRSNLIALKFVWSDAAYAERFLEILVDDYQERRSELYEPLGAETFFRKQAARAADDLAAAEDALQAYLSDAGVTLIDGPRDNDVLEAEKRATLQRLQNIDQELSNARAEQSQLRSLLQKVRAQVLAESVRVRVDLLDRQRAEVRKQQRQLNDEAAGQEAQLARLRQERTEVGEKLAQIRVREDRLRRLLLNGDGTADTDGLKREVDRIYAELANLGQVKRYDLNIGQDTSLYEHIDGGMVDTEVQLSGLRERARVLDQQLQDLDASADAALPVADNAASRPEAIWPVVESTRGLLAAAGTLLDINDRSALAQVFEERIATLVSTEAQFEGVQARVSELEQQADSVDARLADLNRKAAHAKGLRRELTRAEDAYTLYREKTDTASISAAMSREELVNTSIAEPPTASSQPVGPSKRLTLLIGLFVAVSGGIGLALLIDYLDHGLATPGELERHLGIVHLASVPEGETEGPLEIGLAALHPSEEASTARKPESRRSQSSPALVCSAISLR